MLTLKQLGLASAVAAPVIYGLNALTSQGERWDRTAINTAGNIAGGFFGIPGAFLGGYLSDRVADVFDPTGGFEVPFPKQVAMELLNQHLSQPTRKGYAV